MGFLDYAVPFGIITYLQYDGMIGDIIGSRVEADLRRRMKNLRDQDPEDTLAAYDRDVLTPSFYEGAIEEVKGMKPVGPISFLIKHSDLKSLNLWLEKSKKHNPRKRFT